MRSLFFSRNCSGVGFARCGVNPIAILIFSIPRRLPVRSRSAACFAGVALARPRWVCASQIPKPSGNTLESVFSVAVACPIKVAVAVTAEAVLKNRRREIVGRFGACLSMRSSVGRIHPRSTSTSALYPKESLRVELAAIPIQSKRTSVCLIPHATICWDSREIDRAISSNSAARWVASLSGTSVHCSVTKLG